MGYTSITRIEDMLNYAGSKNGVVYEKLLEYCNRYATDRRYKPFLLAATCSWSYNQTGIIRYMNVDYYFRQLEDNTFRVELR